MGRHAKTDLLVERLEQLLQRQHTELDELETHYKTRRKELQQGIAQLEFIRGGSPAGIDLVDALSTAGATDGRKRRHMSAAARRKIGAAMKARWAERKGKAHPTVKVKAKKAKKGGAQFGWTKKEDNMIVRAVKAKDKAEVPEIARHLAPKLPNRSEGAIRQHMVKLVHAGVLKQSSNGSSGEHGGVPRTVVEAVA